MALEDTVAAGRRLDLGSLFCLIGRHGPAVLLAAAGIVALLVALLIYWSLRGKRWWRRSAAGSPSTEPREPGCVAEVQASRPEEELQSTDAQSDEGEEVDGVKSELKARRRRRQVVAAALEKKPLPPPSAPVEQLPEEASEETEEPENLLQMLQKVLTANRQENMTTDEPSQTTSEGALEKSSEEPNHQLGVTPSAVSFDLTERLDEEDLKNMVPWGKVHISAKRDKEKESLRLEEKQEEEEDKQQEKKAEENEVQVGALPEEHLQPVIPTTRDDVQGEDYGLALKEYCEAPAEGYGGPQMSQLDFQNQDCNPTFELLGEELLRSYVVVDSNCPSQTSGTEEFPDCSPASDHIEVSPPAPPLDESHHFPTLEPQTLSEDQDTVTRESPESITDHLELVSDIPETTSEASDLQSIMAGFCGMEKKVEERTVENAKVKIEAAPAEGEAYPKMVLLVHKPEGHGQEEELFPDSTHKEEEVLPDSTDKEKEVLPDATDKEEELHPDSAQNEKLTPKSIQEDVILNFTLKEEKLPSDSTQEEEKLPHDTTQEKEDPFPDSTHKEEELLLDSTHREEELHPDSAINEELPPKSVQEEDLTLNSTPKEKKLPSDSTHEQKLLSDSAQKEQLPPKSIQEKDLTLKATLKEEELSHDTTQEEEKLPLDTTQEEEELLPDSTHKKEELLPDSTHEQKDLFPDSTQEKVEVQPDVTVEKEKLLDLSHKVEELLPVSTQKENLPFNSAHEEDLSLNPAQEEELHSDSTQKEDLPFNSAQEEGLSFNSAQKKELLHNIRPEVQLLPTSPDCIQKQELLSNFTQEEEVPPNIVQKKEELFRDFAEKNEELLPVSTLEKKLSSNSAREEDLLQDAAQEEKMTRSSTQMEMQLLPVSTKKEELLSNFAQEEVELHNDSALDEEQPPASTLEELSSDSTQDDITPTVATVSWWSSGGREPAPGDWIMIPEFLAAANEDMFGHQVESEYQRLMDQFTSQVEASLKAAVEVIEREVEEEKEVEKSRKAGGEDEVNVVEKKGEEIKKGEEEEEKEQQEKRRTEISIMEATMEANEWVTDSGQQPLPWLGIATPELAEESSDPCGRGGPTPRVAAIPPLMPQTVEVTFRLHYLTWSGQQKLAITGSRPELGGWAAFVPLEREGEGEGKGLGEDEERGLWSGRVRLPAHSRLEWKFVVLDRGRVSRWEECRNRVLDTGDRDQLVHGWWGKE